MPGKPLSAAERKAKRDRSKKKIASAVEAGGQINISKASDVTVDVISRSKVSKQRGAAREEQLKRAVTGKYR